MSCKVQQSVCSDCVTYVKSRIKFNTFNTFNNVDQFEVDGKTKDRQKLIKEAMENHKIPTKFRDRLAKSIGDDEDIEETVKAFKQDFITEGLTSEGEQKNKTATEQQVDEAADALLKSITVE